MTQLTPSTIPPVLSKRALESLCGRFRGVFWNGKEMMMDDFTWGLRNIHQKTDMLRDRIDRLEHFVVWSMAREGLPLKSICAMLGWRQNNTSYRIIKRMRLDNDFT